MGQHGSRLPGAGTSSVLAIIVAAAAALVIGMSFALSSAEKILAAEAGPAPSARVIVARARTACFSAMIRVTGFLVPREEAMVTLDVPGLKVVEVLASEVTANFAEGT